MKLTTVLFSLTLGFVVTCQSAGRQDSENVGKIAAEDMDEINERTIFDKHRKSTKNFIELLPGQEYTFPPITTCFTCTPDPSKIYSYGINLDAINKFDSSSAASDDEDHPYLTSQDTVNCQRKLGCPEKPVYTLHIPLNAPPKQFYVVAEGFKYQPLKKYLVKITNRLLLYSGQTYTLPPLTLSTSKKVLDDDTITTLSPTLDNYPHAQDTDKPSLKKVILSNKSSKTGREQSTTTTYQIVIPSTAPAGIFTIDGYNTKGQKIRTVYTVSVYKRINLKASSTKRISYKLPALTSPSHQYVTHWSGFSGCLRQNQDGWFLNFPSRNLNCRIDIFDTSTRTTLPAYQIFLQAPERSSNSSIQNDNNQTTLKTEKRL